MKGNSSMMIPMCQFLSQVPYTCGFISCLLSDLKAATVANFILRGGNSQCETEQCA